MNNIQKEMLEATFVKTGGRDENPQIAEICSKIASEQLLKQEHKYNALLGKYNRLLGEYQGTIEGIMVWDIPEELKVKLSDVLLQIKSKA